MTWIDSHATDQTHRRVILMEWTIGGSTYYWAAWDVPIVTSGANGAPAAVWTPWGLSVSGVTWQQDKLTEQAQIVLEPSATVQALLVYGGASGTPLKIWEAWLNPSGETTVPEQERLILQAIVDAWRLTPDGAELTTAPPVAADGVPIPRRTYGTTCSFRFKGEACQYAGIETSCDHSWSRCGVLSNQTHFGGFPLLAPLGG